MTRGIEKRYDELAACGEIEPDAAQRKAVRALTTVSDGLRDWRPETGGLLSLFVKHSFGPPKGLYIHGPVGRGKTMLMDLFYSEVRFGPRRRVHFHGFMAEVHDRIAEARKTIPGDPIPKIAPDIAKNARLLCFDEFHVTDIADAMILGRLFKGLFEEGVVVVATSNVAPDALYADGLNRQLFLPFIGLLKENMNVIELATQRDYRFDKLQGQNLYFSPADSAARAQIDLIFEQLTEGMAPTPQTLDVKGRPITVQSAAAGVARFGFADLCDAPLGALDYLKIAEVFHTVIIEDIPKLPPARRNEARRFITLIDTLYDKGTCLIASAEASPEDLYPDGDGAQLFERTVSRLIEMRSAAYLEKFGRDAPANPVIS